MITLLCDKCEKPFTVDDSFAGKKVPCPACGDINVARGGGGSVAAGDRAAGLGLPPSNGPEVTILTTRGAMFRAAPFSFSLLLLLTLAGGAGAAGLAFTGQLPLALGALAVGVIGLVWLMVWKIRNWGERLEITTKRVVFTEGILSKKSLEMVYRTIQDIEIKQTFAARLMNIGTITIANASSDDDMVILHDVPSPYRIREIIDAYRPM